MNHSRRTRLNKSSLLCVRVIVLIFTSHQVIESWIGGHHLNRRTRMIFLTCLVHNRDTIVRQLSRHTIETLRGRIDNCRLEVCTVIFSTDKEGIILNMVFYKVHNLQRVTCLCRDVACLLLGLHLFPGRQLLGILQSLNTLIARHIDRIVISIKR